MRKISEEVLVISPPWILLLNSFIIQKYNQIAVRKQQTIIFYDTQDSQPVFASFYNSPQFIHFYPLWTVIANFRFFYEVRSWKSIPAGIRRSFGVSQMGHSAITPYISMAQEKIIMQPVLRYLADHKFRISAQLDVFKSSIPYYALALIILFGYNVIFTHPWLLIAMVYGLLPLLDQVFEVNTRNPTEKERKELEQNDLYFKTCVFLTLAVDWIVFFYILHHISSIQLDRVSKINFFGAFFIYSNVMATQFTISHQIYHKLGFINKCVGTLHMIKNLYMHFSYEHIYGHHRNVATPEDPATAPKNVTVYQFFWRSLVGTFANVYNMEKENNKPFYFNCAVLSILGSVIFTAFIYWVFNLKTMLFFLAQGILSVFFLETINYIEHYGLLRKRLVDGSYEKVTIRHSWNAPYLFTNYLLFKLQRHSDHHQNSLKPYQTLVSLEQSPKMPHGYSLMVSLAYFPKLWFSIMNPLVQQYSKEKIQDISKEVVEKCSYQTRRFLVRLAVAVTALWLMAEWCS